MKTAIIIGSTGLVGNEVLKLTLNDGSFNKVKIFIRRPVKTTNPKLEKHIVDFNKINKWKNELTGDVLFSSLGTTIKNAGSKEAQYLVDYTYQFEIAKCASENRVKKFVLVSSAGANPNSKIFYSRMKGELDRDIQKLNFEKIRILRPSLLLGNRSEYRLGEKIGEYFGKYFISYLPFIKKYKPINASIVAQAMINSIDDKRHLRPRSLIFELDEIFSLAKND